MFDQLPRSLRELLEHGQHDEPIRLDQLSLRFEEVTYRRGGEVQKRRCFRLSTRRHRMPPVVLAIVVVALIGLLGLALGHLWHFELLTAALRVLREVLV